MKLLAHIAAAWLGVNLGILAAAVTAAYREHERHLTDAAWDAHVGDALAVASEPTRRAADAVAEFSAHLTDALAVAEPVLPAALWDAACTCDDWTADELIALAPDLVELDGVETFADFLYVTGGEAQ